MRCFIALPLPPLIQRHLSDIQRELKLHVRPRAFRWVSPNQTHLTLDFLGDVSTLEASTIKQNVYQALMHQLPLDLSLTDLGSFGTPPRVIWAGVGGDLEGLMNLQSNLRLSQASQPFTPHLTLARVRPKEYLDRGYLSRALSKVSPEPLNWQAQSVVMFKSELLPQGARYTRLWEQKFSPDMAVSYRTSSHLTSRPLP